MDSEKAEERLSKRIKEYNYQNSEEQIEDNIRNCGDDSEQGITLYYEDFKAIKKLLKEREELKPKADKYDKAIENLERELAEVKIKYKECIKNNGSNYEMTVLETKLKQLEKVLEEMRLD